MLPDWGYIHVSNHSFYVGTFTVTCQFLGENLSFNWGGGFPAGQTKTTRIPGNATDISIDFHCYVVAHHTSHIATKQFADISSWTNGEISYTMTGVTASPHVHP